MSIDNNPLKQYFRRPAVFLRLPSEGKEYPEGIIDMPVTGEIPVYPMTAIDEITTKTPDALFNGSAIVELVKSCVPNIKDPWKISSSDLDAVLIAINAASGGNELEIESQCPSCTNVSNYGVNLINVLAGMKAPDYGRLLTIGELGVKFKPLTYKEMNEASLGQFEVQRTFLAIEQVQNNEEKNKLGQDALRKVTELTMTILCKAIEYIKTPNSQVNEPNYILDFLRNCDKNMYTIIRDYNAELKAKTELPPLDIECPSCTHKYKQPFTLNATDFFG